MEPEIPPVDAAAEPSNPSRCDCGALDISTLLAACSDELIERIQQDPSDRSVAQVTLSFPQPLEAVGDLVLCRLCRSITHALRKTQATADLGQVDVSIYSSERAGLKGLPNPSLDSYAPFPIIKFTFAKKGPSGSAQRPLTHEFAVTTAGISSSENELAAPRPQTWEAYLESAPSPGLNWSGIKRALSTCRDEHTTSCGHVLPQGIPGLHVIDCATRTLVPFSDHVKRVGYATLSYVWGAATRTLALSTGSNLPQRLPLVVEDALKVCLSLDLRYLWIDRYCILQDDPTTKRNQIRRMNLIYKQSELTIIAAAGSGPEYGLPGVSSRRRPNAPQASLLKLGRHALVPTLDLFDLQALHLGRMEDVASSKWNSRGWTYQEGVIARRRLIFTDNLVVFQCLQSKWDERFSCAFPTDELETSGGSEYGVPQFLPHGPIGTDASYFGGHVTEYYGRHLTYLSDRLMAFQGILQEFASSARVRNLCGVPAFRFPDNLKAPAPSSPDVLQTTTQAQIQAKRRSRLSQQLKLFRPSTKPSTVPEAAPDVSESVLTGFVAGLCWDLETSSSDRTGRVEQTPFPSWSWLGWSAPSKDYRVAFPLDRIHTMFLRDVREGCELVAKDVRIGFTTTGMEHGVPNDTETNLESALNSQGADPTYLNITTWTFDGQIAESQQPKTGLIALELRDIRRRAPYDITIKLHNDLVGEPYISVNPRDDRGPGDTSFSARFAVLLSLHDGRVLLCLLLAPCSRHGTGLCFQRIGLVYLSRTYESEVSLSRMDDSEFPDAEARERHYPSNWSDLDEENTLFVESLPGEVCRMESIFVC